MTWHHGSRHGLLGNNITPSPWQYPPQTEITRAVTCVTRFWSYSPFPLPLIVRGLRLPKPNSWERVREWESLFKSERPMRASCRFVPAQWSPVLSLSLPQLICWPGLCSNSQPNLFPPPPHILCFIYTNNPCLLGFEGSRLHSYYLVTCYTVHSVYDEGRRLRTIPTSPFSFLPFQPLTGQHIMQIQRSEMMKWYDTRWG